MNEAPLHVYFSNSQGHRDPGPDMSMCGATL